ncbi:hypothetical protein MIND_00903300 [Mycena indigotica]|uniref:F-box domain-containing protein n=1 Tax=Mycena indigotica TaxID=2126181 RepID=A0A8H6W530_9AGAR|nr:uncharacterized protein MIND_00903300 [Mycena indigotica]KAF7299529.1 hypothetical protein MIND_00903300 [Mycena indigotica]
MHGFHAPEDLQRLQLFDSFNPGQSQLLSDRFKQEVKHHQMVISLLQRALTRSQSIPLTLTVRSMSDFQPGALSLLAVQSFRWESVTIDVPRGMHKELAPLDRGLPMLKTLRITPAYDPTRITGLPLDIPLLAAFASARNLTRLEYSGPLKPLAEAGMTHLPVGGTLSLDMILLASEADLSQLRQNLNHSQSESHILKLKLILSDHARPAAVSPLLELFFGAVPLPHLEGLAIHTPEYVDAPRWPSRAALYMLQPASNTMRELDIVDINITLADLLRLLASLPFLESLAVGDQELPAAPLITDTFFFALLADGVGEQIASLRLWTCRAFSNAMLQEFIARRESGKRFRLALTWVPGTKHVLSDELLGTIQREKERGTLVFECGPVRRA